MLLAKGIAVGIALELAAVAAVLTYLAVSETIGAATIAAVASIANTALLVWNRRTAARRSRELIGEPKEEDSGTVIHELAEARSQLAETQEMLEALNRTIAKRRRMVRDGGEEIVIEEESLR